eukprot:m.340733 g.340733  ORF g.340733 m.340733 type:complete len:537 (-) comp20601_c0_seq1:345-1955(-)
MNIAPAPTSASKQLGKAEIQQLFASSSSQQTGSLPNINFHPNSPSATSTTSATSTIKSSANQQTVSPRKFNKNGSMTPAAALAQYKRVLSPYEQEEVKLYNNVWFVGPTARKLNAGEGKGKNFGYDDDKGRYKCVKNDHISYRYEVQKGLGKGSFGDVVKAYDHKNKCTVALKIIRNEKRFHKQGKCEIKILDHLRRHDRDHKYNVIHMKDYFIFRNHLCLTFEMMHCDLYSALKKDGFRGYSLSRVAGFTSSMVTALKLLKRERLIHCDLKPENILLQNGTSDKLKIIDFGSSCFDTERVHTYIQSRFYRSPEVILGLSYGCAIDMWSLGCILCELYTGQPIFPGHDEKEQLLYQMQVLGVVPQELIAKGKRAANFFADDGSVKHKQDRKGRTRNPGSRPLSVAIGCTDTTFLDFIEKCMIWDPEQRMTPEEAARHPFLRSAEVATSATESTDALATSFSAACVITNSNAPTTTTGAAGTTDKQRRDSKLAIPSASQTENLPPAVQSTTTPAKKKSARSHLGQLASRLTSRKSTK